MRNYSVLLFSFLILGIAVQIKAEPLDVEPSVCKSKKGWYFCTPELELDQAVQAMRNRGNCCQESAFSSYSDAGKKLCTQGDDPIKGIQCSQVIPGTFTPAYSALYDSYGLGMRYDRTQACPTLEGQDSLDTYVDVTGERTPLGMATILREDKALQIAETCYWVLRPERDVWVTDASNLVIRIDQLDGGFLFIMQGNERKNITQSVIQKGDDFVKGSPLTLPIDDDVILIFQRRSKSTEAQFLVSTWINGRQYPWWEKPFVTDTRLYWYLVFFGLLGIVFLSIMCCTCCCVRKCCAGRCCCSACNYCNCVKFARCCKKGHRGGKVQSEVQMLTKGSEDTDGKQGKPSSMPRRMSAIQPGESPEQIVSRKKMMQRYQMEYGDEDGDDSGPIPPVAKKMPRDDISGTTTLLPPVDGIRVEQYNDNAYSTRNLNLTRDEQLRPSSIFKQTPDGGDGAPPESRGGFKRHTPVKATISQLNYLTDAKRNDNIASHRQGEVSGFDQQKARTPQPRLASSEKKGNDGHEPSQVVLFDEDAADRFEKENEAFQHDTLLNPDEDVIDPVTIYRFQENTRRLDRLRAELNNQPIASALPAIRNAGMDDQDRATIDPSEIPPRLNIQSSRSSQQHPLQQQIQSRGLNSRSNMHSRQSRQLNSRGSVARLKQNW